MSDYEDLLRDANASGELTEKQKRIIHAAIASFAEKGYAATSTSEIAKNAGVAEGTIFRHYKTKKDLLYAIITPVIRHLLAPFIIEDLNKVLDQTFDSFESFLREMIANRLLFVEKNLPLIKILIQEIPFQPELQELFLTHVAPEPLAKVKKTIADFQAQGEIIDWPAYTVMRLVASSVAGYLSVRHILASENHWDDVAERERTIQFILKGLQA